MIDLGKWAFGHSKLVYFLLAVLLVGGLKSAYDMGKLEDPEVKVKIAMVVGVRPGASAHEMELEVTDPLEKAIRTVGEVDNTQSWSYNDLCIIQVELKSTTPDDRLEQCWDMLRHKVSDAEASLPGGTSVTVQDDFSLVYGMFYALTAEGQPPITGEIIMETYGVPPSRVIGEIKEIIKEAILEGEIPNDYEAAYALMERLAEERGLRKKQ